MVVVVEGKFSVQLKPKLNNISEVVLKPTIQAQIFEILFVHLFKQPVAERVKSSRYLIDYTNQISIHYRPFMIIYYEWSAH